jgi:hypothetical protein
LTSFSCLDRLIQHTLLPPPPATGFFDDSALSAGTAFVHASRRPAAPAGADEDDFHALKRTRDAVEIEERREELQAAAPARKAAPKAKKAKVVSF